MLEILSKKTNNEDFIIKKIKELMKEFEEKEDDHFKLKILDNYIKTNEKKYLKKIKDDKWVLYTYESYYRWYPSPKMNNIKDIFTILFRSEEFTYVKIDDIKFEIKWNDNLIIDLKNEKKIEFEIKI